MSKIRHIKNRDIDRKKWDACIIDANNGLIYARSVYLDSMCENWDGLVLNDYETVMPLPYKTKGGIPYLYQPFFTQQGGIFGKNASERMIVASFLEKALRCYIAIQIHINYANKGFGVERCNLVLRLDKPFRELKVAFRKNIIARALKHNLCFEEDDDYDAVIADFKRYYAKKTSVIQPADYARFRDLCSKLLKMNMMIVRKVVSANGETVSSAIFFKDNKRLYYIMAVLKPEGRKFEASAFLIYKSIEEHAEKKIVFDFEGSEIPSIQSFFNKFGAKEEPYFVFRKRLFGFL